MITYMNSIERKVRCSQAWHYIRPRAMSDVEYGRLLDLQAEDPEAPACVPYIRHSEDGRTYIEAYVTDMLLGGQIESFIIAEDYCMPEEKEREFDQYCIEEKVVVDDELLDRIYVLYQEKHPELHLRKYEHPMILLNHIYYAQNRGTVKEILYKAELTYLAAHLDELGEYNMIGGSPHEIFEVPLKLLRRLDNPYGAELLGMEDRRELLCRIYRAFPEQFEEIYCFNELQMKYLKKVISENKYSEEDDMIINSLGEGAIREDQYSMYLDYLEKREVLKEYFEFPLVPEWEDEDPYFEGYPLENLYRNITKLYFGMAKWDKRITCQNKLHREYEGRYLYKDKTYVMKLPEGFIDMVKEGQRQNNCVRNYIRYVANGLTVILFLRRAERPEKSFVTLEIRKGRIVQALGANNAEVSSDVRDFLSYYAELKGLVYITGQDAHEE